MGKREIRPLATPQPLNRLSQKFAHVIISWMSTDTQNLVTIPQGVSFPRMHEIAHQNIYSASYISAIPGTSNSLQPRHLNRFSHVIGQTTVFRAKKPPFLGPDFDGTSKIFDRKQLYNGGAPM